jgi:hypothetical protein
MKREMVQVPAEWALWGKEPHDVEYRLLRHSEGALGANQFDEVITRYAPGTLEDLPQVTIAWLATNQTRSYLVAARHRTPDHRLYDASGRQVVLTDCFCIPFEELAAKNVSYQELYEGLRKTPLPAAGRAGITIDLPVLPPRPPSRGFAMRVAALLLTDVPVCILGANGVGLEARLRFFDSVMTLLPYGMRSRLSASTWTSSIFEEHKFRLFFSGADRHAGDHVLVWNPRYRVSIRRDDVDNYLSWLASDLRANVALLAGQTGPTGFKPDQVARMMRKLREQQGR